LYREGDEIMNKKIIIFGGGTISHVRTHLALCAPAYGTTAKKLAVLCRNLIPNMDVKLELTKMAGGFELETNDDIKNKIDKYLEDPLTKVIIMSAAICDYDGSFEGISGKYKPKIAWHSTDIQLKGTNKLISSIRENRKDVFLVGFKTTSNASPGDQYSQGLRLCKNSSCNLVLANDIVTRLNMIVCPEEARYSETTDRDSALNDLVEMIKLRSNLTFTRSTVINGTPVK